MNVRAAIGLLLFLFLTTPAPPAAAQAETADAADPANVEEPISIEEPTAITERVRHYLQRHGDNGVIDPARRLKQITAVHEELTARAKRGAETVLAEPAWMSLGPTNGAGRMTALAPHPTAIGTVYAGAAGGGVWKTTDGGSTWTALTETLNDLSVGAVALAPSSPNIVYVGSGEGGYGGDFIPGNGFFKSTNGGATWALPSSVVASMFYRISVHPTNPSELLAGSNQGMLRSTDGGSNWATTIAPSEGDVTEVVRHPSNPAIVWAGAWCKESYSPTTRMVQKSTDGGLTWAPSSTGRRSDVDGDRRADGIGEDLHERPRDAVPADPGRAVQLPVTRCDGERRLNV